jgi:hypothetical protein
MATMTYPSAAQPAPAERDPVERAPLVRWPAVLSGAAVGFATFFIVSALWFALAGTSGTNFFSHNLAWFLLGDALFASIVAGYVGGYVLRLREAHAGALTGLTVWGLLMFISLIIGFPQLSTVLHANEAGTGAAANAIASSTLWATFGAFVGGFLLAGLSGASGAKTTDPLWRRRIRLVRTTPEPPPAPRLQS